MLRYAWPLVQTVKAIFLIHLTTEHLFAIHYSLGTSMLPTLNSVGDTLAVDKLFFKWNLEGGPRSRFFNWGLGVGDIVFAISPLGGGRGLCKRIVGMPGDVVCVDPIGDPNEYIKVRTKHQLD